MAAILPLVFLLLCLTVTGEHWRDRFARAAVLFGGVLVGITEALSFVARLTPAVVAIAWSGTALLLAAPFVRRRRTIAGAGMDSWRIGWLDAAMIAAIVAVLAVIAATALLSPPNSADAMAYHLPRVLYWIQQRSVAFFPTPYLNQIMLAPFAEYFMLHTVLLSGGDGLVNLVQWFGCVTSIVAVSLIARELGAGRRGQILAALFCATLPNGILQASGAKNDYLLAAWLAVLTWSRLRLCWEPLWQDGPRNASPGDESGPG